jgi:hypothetical protein
MFVGIEQILLNVILIKNFFCFHFSGIRWSRPVNLKFSLICEISNNFKFLTICEISNNFSTICDRKNQLQCRLATSSIWTSGVIVFRRPVKRWPSFQTHSSVPSCPEEFLLFRFVITIETVSKLTHFVLFCFVNLLFDRVLKSCHWSENCYSQPLKMSNVIIWFYRALYFVNIQNP